MAAEVEIHTQSRIRDFVRWGLTRIYRTTTYIGEDTVIQQGQIALQSQNYLRCSMCGSDSFGVGFNSDYFWAKGPIRDMVEEGVKVRKSS